MVLEVSHLVVQIWPSAPIGVGDWSMDLDVIPRVWMRGVRGADNCAGVVACGEEGACRMDARRAGAVLLGSVDSVGAEVRDGEALVA